MAYQRLPAGIWPVDAAALLQTLDLADVSGHLPGFDLPRALGRLHIKLQHDFGPCGDSTDFPAGL